MDRRHFLGTAAATTLSSASAQQPRPNILWVTCEDIGPEISPYGDTYATTPNLEKLAARGWRYDNAWSNAPVCAPARTTLISGMYPPSLGGEHMRSEVSLPPIARMYPQYLRDAGYYCTNNSKTDYNLVEPGQVWDESSNKAHWRKRAAGQPFFSIFNFTTTHESQIRRRPHTLVHDPAKARVPAYHPDTPEVRHDWAQYYDNITTMDTQTGKVLAELEADGLAQDTIVFFYGDHGSGMPRSKRWPYNSGLRVPLLVSVPDKYKALAPAGYRAGGHTDRLVSFVDLAPTLLSLIGSKPPAHMQGHAFMGPHAEPEQPYIYGFRGRMDERVDMVRSVRDKRYIYIRNYMPHRIYGQHIGYMFETPTTRVWNEMYKDGKLNESQRIFWEKKPSEELYDLENDRDEVHNLAAKPEYKDRVARMRKAQEDHAVRIKDVGFLPEGEIHERAVGSTPYQVGHDPAKYPQARIMAMAALASDGTAKSLDRIKKGFADSDSAVRYWAAQGVLAREAEGLKHCRKEVEAALADSSPYVRAISAEALGRFGSQDDRARAIPVLMEVANAEKNGAYAPVLALNALNYLQDGGPIPVDQIAKLPVLDRKAPKRALEYPTRLVKTIVERGN
ncbi:MAG: sulfatase-like hydrolase/transferase [Bryobacteraceae bacterium]